MKLIDGSVSGFRKQESLRFSSMYLLRGVYIHNQIPIFHLNMALNYAYILHGVGTSSTRTTPAACSKACGSAALSLSYLGKDLCKISANDSVLSMHLTF